MLAVGDLEDARRARDELQELAGVFDTDGLRAVVAQADGAIALGEGHAPAALDPLRRAFEQWQRLEAPYEAARVRVLIGEACRALGDDEAAALEHEAARSEFERLGAQPELARLDAPTTPRRRRARAHPLTARELQVLRLISTGRTNKDIADELCLSERTIDRHVSNILSKLDVPSARSRGGPRRPSQAPLTRPPGGNYPFSILAVWVVSPKRQPPLLLHSRLQKESAMRTPRIAVAGLCTAMLCCPAVANGDAVLEWNAIMVAVVAGQPRRP